ncbi:hypothetical protein B0T11DRAFT_23498 [Plectosphaerella cucumerina]|uniref:Uncharacterized protein n=1 Tax=Plectosphaerella cucumerina TaxID=40658 RepID=A0A8K0TUY1_9PEZI|nr:hypothetical protein B0T11DRAFT_23498 [Plectosphaerella cucumerina]
MHHSRRPPGSQQPRDAILQGTPPRTPIDQALQRARAAYQRVEQWVVNAQGDRPSREGRPSLEGLDRFSRAMQAEELSHHQMVAHLRRESSQGGLLPDSGRAPRAPRETRIFGYSSIHSTHRAEQDTFCGHRGHSRYRPCPESPQQTPNHGPGHNPSTGMSHQGQPQERQQHNPNPHQSHHWFYGPPQPTRQYNQTPVYAFYQGSSHHRQPQESQQTNTGLFNFNSLRGSSHHTQPSQTPRDSLNASEVCPYSAYLRNPDRTSMHGEHQRCDVNASCRRPRNYESTNLHSSPQGAEQHPPTDRSHQEQSSLAEEPGQPDEDSVDDDRLDEDQVDDDVQDEVSVVELTRVERHVPGPGDWGYQTEAAIDEHMRRWCGHPWCGDPIGEDANYDADDEDTADPVSAPFPEPPPPYSPSAPPPSPTSSAPSPPPNSPSSPSPSTISPLFPSTPSAVLDNGTHETDASSVTIVGDEVDPHEWGDDMNAA